MVLLHGKHETAWHDSQPSRSGLKQTSCRDGLKNLKGVEPECFRESCRANGKACDAEIYQAAIRWNVALLCTREEGSGT